LLSTVWALLSASSDGVGVGRFAAAAASASAAENGAAGIHIRVRHRHVTASSRKPLRIKKNPKSIFTDGVRPD